MKEHENEIDFDDIAGVFIKRWKLIFFTSIVAAFAVFAALRVSPKIYEKYALFSMGSVGGRALDSADSLTSLMGADYLAIGITEKENECGTIKCSDYSGFVKVAVRSYSVQRAEKIMSSVISYIGKREDSMLIKTKAELDQSIAEIKSIMKNSFYTSFPDPTMLKIIPTKFESVSPVIPSNQQREGRKIAAAAVFVFVFIITSLIAFYLEGKNK